MTSPASTTELPDDVAAAAGSIAARLRTKTIDQVVAIGERTGWWTAELVDWVADGRNGPAPAGPVVRPSLRQVEDLRLEELQEELADAGVVAPSGHLTDTPAAAPPSLPGAAEMHRALNATDEEIAQLQQAAADIGADEPNPDMTIAGSAYLAVLQAHGLGVDHSYQRPLDEARVSRMAAAWDPRMLGTIDVSDRGPEEKPRYAVINGQHRAATAAKVSPAGADVWLACMVHEGLDVAAEAALMYELDRSTKKLSGWDQWYARRGAGDPAVLAVESVAARHGLRVDNAPMDGTLRSYGTAEKLLKLGGEQLLDNALAVLRAAYGEAAAAYQAPLLMGVGQLIHQHADVEIDRLTRALAGTRPEQLRSTATALRDVDGGPLHELMTRAIVGQYNRTPGSGLRGRLTGARA